MWQNGVYLLNGNSEFSDKYSTGGEIFDIVIESERTTKPGRAGLFSDTVNPLAKADIPLAYAKALDGYNNAETEQADAVQLGGANSGNFPIIQYIDGKYHYVESVFPNMILKNSENIDLSNPATVFNFGEGFTGCWQLFDNINIVIVNKDQSSDSKLRIYSKAWVLLQEYNNDYGLGDSGLSAFISKFYKYDGYIYITTASGVIKIADNASAYTPVFYYLGKYIHSLAKFKNNWFFCYADGLAEYVTTYFSKSSTLDSLGTTLCIGGKYIAHNADYIVCQHIRDSSVTGDWNVYTGISADGSNWSYYGINHAEIPSEIFFKGTENNKFIVYGAKIGITSTSNPLTWTGKTTTSLYGNIPLENKAAYSPNGIAFVKNEDYFYSAVDKKIYTDTIEGIDIEYYKTPTGQKICLPSQNTALANLYAITGDNSYLVLDTVNETLQLYRRNIGYEYMIVDPDYVCSLTNNVSQERFAKISDMTTKTLYTQKTDNTSTGNNSDAEFSLIGSGVGSLTLPKYLLSVGKKISLQGWGIISGVNGTSTTIKIKLGDTTIVTNTSNLPTALTDIKFKFEADIDVRSTGTTGTVICGGATIIYSAVGFGTLTARNFYTISPVEIDTTSDLTIGLTYQFGTASASNSILLKDLSVVAYN